MIKKAIEEFKKVNKELIIIKPTRTYNNLVMRKIYIILCILGIALPYYNLINYLKINNWSMDGF
ncbi:MAG: hypothetical protein CM15mP102_09460 [Flavobacteriales bacterium]|nr:MAG: hypothetical protein CM15mP102_09460 [Flavobacteriales bacterium]